MVADLHLGFQKDSCDVRDATKTKGICLKDFWLWKEGLEQERKNGRGCGRWALTAAWPPAAPRREKAEASVLGLEPTYLLHCLFWPPSWSTGKKAGEAGFAAATEHGLLSRYFVQR